MENINTSLIYILAALFGLGWLLQTSETSVLILSGGSHPIPIQTCHGECGVDRATPCSCHARCLVLGNCCHNITEDCPDIVEEARLMYGSLVGASVSCHETGFIMIHSCSKPSSELLPMEEAMFGDDDTSLLESEEEVLQQAISSEPVNPTDIAASLSQAPKLRQALLSIPVTDLTSGFTFKNKTVYQHCKTSLKNKTDIFEWNVRKHVETFSNPLTLQDIELDSRHTIEPSFDIRLLRNSRCKFGYGIINTCKPGDTIHLNGIYNTQEYCLSFPTSYVITQYNRFYRNPFCLICNEGLETAMTLWRTQTDAIHEEFLSYSVVYKMSGALGIKLTFDYGQFATRNASWTDTVCQVNYTDIRATESERIEYGYSTTSGSANDRTDMPEFEIPGISDLIEIPGISDLIEKSTELEAKTPIDCIPTCEPGYEMSPDGVCRIMQTIQIAIPDDEISEHCPGALANLPQFLRCGLQLWSEEVDFRPELASHITSIYDKRSKAVLHVAQLQFLWIDKYDLMYESNTIRTKLFASASLAVRAFKRFWRSESEEGNEAVCKSETMDDSPKLNIATQRYEDTNAYFDFIHDVVNEILRGPRDTDRGHTVVCFSGSSYTFKPTEFRLRCLHDAERASDDRLVDILLNTTCSKPSGGSSGSGVTDMMNSSSSMGQLCTRLTLCLTGLVTIMSLELYLRN